MKTEANIQFGQQVAKIRKSRGLSQEQLAYKCGFDRTYVGTIERGEKKCNYQQYRQNCPRVGDHTQRPV